MIMARIVYECKILNGYARAAVTNISDPAVDLAFGATNLMASFVGVELTSLKVKHQRLFDTPVFSVRILADFLDNFAERRPWIGERLSERTVNDPFFTRQQSTHCLPLVLAEKVGQVFALTLRRIRAAEKSLGLDIGF